MTLNSIEVNTRRAILLYSYDSAVRFVLKRGNRKKKTAKTAVGRVASIQELYHGHRGSYAQTHWGGTSCHEHFLSFEHETPPSASEPAPHQWPAQHWFRAQMPFGSEGGVKLRVGVGPAGVGLGPTGVAVGTP